MDLATEIAKYQALLRFAVDNNDDVQRELQYQAGVLRSLGVDDGAMNNLIHDRYSRENISRTRTEVVLASVRQAAGIVGPNSRGNWPSRASAPTIAEQTAEYMRRTGRGTRHRLESSPSLAGARVDPAVPTIPPTARLNAFTGDNIGDGLRRQRSQPERVEFENTLSVPYGLHPDNTPVRAQEAVSGIAYTCLGCKGPLTLKSGPQRTKHFAHKVATTCDGESALHKTAKALVAKVMSENAAATTRVRLRCTCSACRREFDKVLGADAFNGAVVEAKVEGFRCDVVGLRDNQPVLAVEIFNTHAVDAHKEESLSISWVELVAAEVIEDPYYWRSVNGKLKPTVCNNCRASDRALKRVATRWLISLPEAPYVAATAPCWSCKEEIIWYWWPGVPFATEHPPQPAPPNVQFRYSKMYGASYWMNVCPGCRAPQGDNFVFLAEDSPFSRLPMHGEEEMRDERVRVQTEGAVALFKAVLKKNF
jgi:hypothetical protein